MSAHDVAIIARRLILDYPEVLEITQKLRLTLQAWHLHHPTTCSKTCPPFERGVDGLKTGTSDKGGSSFVGTIQQRGMRLITVLLNVNHADEDEECPLYGYL